LKKLRQTERRGCGERIPKEWDWIRCIKRIGSKIRVERKGGDYAG